MPTGQSGPEVAVASTASSASALRGSINTAENSSGEGRRVELGTAAWIVK